MGCAEIALREITFATVREIIALDVNNLQRGYVASNATSIAEAHFNPGAWFRAIIAGDTPVGFVMLLDPQVPGAILRSPIDPGDIELWRLMIDHRYQQKGYGRQALDLICAFARDTLKSKCVVSSYVAGEHGPEGFYVKYGFRKTGRLRNKGSEIEIWRGL